jgi:hypothetical protein
MKKISLGRVLINGRPNPDLFAPYAERKWVTPCNTALLWAFYLPNPHEKRGRSTLPDAFIGTHLISQLVLCGMSIAV